MNALACVKLGFGLLLLFGQPVVGSKIIDLFIYFALQNVTEYNGFIKV
jgi:hypothetical protein